VYVDDGDVIVYFYLTLVQFEGLLVHTKGIRELIQLKVAFSRLGVDFGKLLFFPMSLMNAVQKRAKRST
jgi:hypothetical protein